MKTVKLNIGLENNPFDFEQIIEQFSIFNKIISARIEVGEYNGEPERTAVIEVESGIDTNKSLSQTEYLTKLFTQECIAVKIDDVGYLIYNPNFEGEKFEFDQKYFIEP